MSAPGGTRLVGTTRARPIRARVADSPRRGPAGIVALSLGPSAVVAGLVWALLQPDRVTLLNPHGESFWWLAVQPPLLVVLAGVVFHGAVARGLVKDLVEAERRRAKTADSRGQVRESPQVNVQR